MIASALSVVVIAALITLAVTKLDLGGVGRALGHVTLGWLLLAFAAMASAFLARAESWFAVVRASIPEAPVGRTEVRRALLIGVAGSTVGPARLGEAARTWILARRIGPLGAYLGVVVGTVIWQVLINVLALCILTAIALTGGAISVARVAALGAVIVLPGLLILLLLAGPSALTRASEMRRTRCSRALQWIAEQLVRVRDGLRAFRHPGAAAHGTIFQLGAWALQLCACYVVLLALGIHHDASIAIAAGVLVAVNVTAIVPLTPSNVGVFQAACIAVLASFGVSASRGLAYGLVLQAIEILCSLSLGIPALLREGLSWSELRRVAIGASSVSPGQSHARPEQAAERAKA